MVCISVTIGPIVIRKKKLYENVGTEIPLIVLRFHTDRFADIVMTSFLIFGLFFSQRNKILRQREIMILLCLDCDTSDSVLIVTVRYIISHAKNHKQSVVNKSMLLWSDSDSRFISNLYVCLPKCLFEYIHLLII